MILRTMLSFSRPTLIFVFFALSWKLAYGSDGKRELQCSENNAKLTQYVSDDQKVHALWGQKYKDDHFFYCGFTEDHKIRLTDLNWFVKNREAVVDKSISIYKGRSNTCSEGKLLIFNDRTNLVMILNVHDFTTEKYQCANP